DGRSPDSFMPADLRRLPRGGGKQGRSAPASEYLSAGRSIVDCLLVDFLADPVSPDGSTFISTACWIARSLLGPVVCETGSPLPGLCKKGGRAVCSCRDHIIHWDRTRLTVATE